MVMTIIKTRKYNQISSKPENVTKYHQNQKQHYYAISKIYMSREIKCILPWNYNTNRNNM